MPKFGQLFHYHSLSPHSSPPTPPHCSSLLPGRATHATQFPRELGPFELILENLGGLSSLNVVLCYCPRAPTIQEGFDVSYTLVLMTGKQK